MGEQSTYWDSVIRRNIDRRRLLASGALLAAGGAISAACGSRKGAGTSGASTSGTAGAGGAATIIGKEWNAIDGSPKYGGTLQWESVAPALASLDPILSASAMVHQVVSNGYSKLMRIGRKSDDINSQVIFPDLATTWEIADPTTWTFHLRPGVKFQDVAPVNGRDLTAADIKYSLLRAATDKTSQLQGGYVNMDSIEVPDDHTIVLKLKHFDSLLSSNLAGHYGWVVPHEVVESSGLKNTIVGSGPFVFQNWEQDSVVNFKKNPNYYLKGVPFIDELKLLQIGSEQDRITALRSAQIFNYEQITPAEYNQLKSVSNLTATKYAVVDPRVIFMNYKVPIFQDDRVRKALSLAVSRDASLKILNQGEGLWRGVISNQNSGWTLSQDELKSKDYFLRQDVAEAKQLLAAAGHADGFETELLYNSSYPDNYQNNAQYLQQAWAAIGVKVNLVGQEQTTFRKNQDTHSYKGLIYGLDGEALPEAYLLDYHTDGPKNGSGVSLPWLDQAIDDTLATVDESARKAKAKDLTKQILKQVPWKFEICDSYQYEMHYSWAKNWFDASPQVYNTTGVAFTWIDK